MVDKYNRLNKSPGRAVSTGMKRNLVRLTLRLPLGVVRSLKVAAAGRGQSVADLIVIAARLAELEARVVEPTLARVRPRRGGGGKAA